MIKHISISFFVLLVLLQTFDKFGMIAYYQLNKKNITELFCINKDEPILMCSGQCYLGFKLTEQQENKGNSSIVDTKKNIQLFLEDHSQKSVSKVQENLTKCPSFYLFHFSEPDQKVLFLPPRV